MALKQKQKQNPSFVGGLGYVFTTKFQACVSIVKSSQVGNFGGRAAAWSKFLPSLHLVEFPLLITLACSVVFLFDNQFWFGIDARRTIFFSQLETRNQSQYRATQHCLALQMLRNTECSAKQMLTNEGIDLT